MTVLNDIEIRQLIDEGCISPGEKQQIGRVERIASYGTSHFGYDVRLDREFIRYIETDRPLDPMDIREEDYERFYADKVVIEAGGFLLATTMEYFRIPSDMYVRPVDKSTYARSGLHVQNTMVDPGFCGQVTLEIVNHLKRPVILRAGHGISQFMFHRGPKPSSDYATRGGKYMNQVGTVLPRM